MHFIWLLFSLAPFSLDWSLGFPYCFPPLWCKCIYTLWSAYIYEKIIRSLGRINVIILWVQIWSPEGKRRGDWKKVAKEIITKNFSHLIKTIKPHIQEAQWTISKGNIKKITLKHILIKWLKPEIIIIVLRRKSKTSWRKTGHTPQRGTSATSWWYWQRENNEATSLQC